VKAICFTLLVLAGLGMWTELRAAQDANGFSESFREDLKYCEEQLSGNRVRVVERQSRRPAVEAHVLIFEIARDLENLMDIVKTDVPRSPRDVGFRELHFLQRDFDELHEALDENRQSGRWKIDDATAEVLDECTAIIHPEIDTQ
jgi:hypothetical protein